MPHLILIIIAAAGLSASQAEAPRIDDVDCAAFTEVEAGVDADCGMLRVPENRAAPGGRLIGVPYLRIHSTAAEPAPDPLIIVTGGPGGRTVPGKATHGHPALARRDVIWLNQRGTPPGEPDLQCPEYAEAGRQAALGRLDAAALRQARIAAAKNCADRARESGIDLAGYNSHEIVGDIEALRSLLGYDSVNLYGMSYSGRVMSQYAADHPEVTRSIILNTPMTIEADYDEYGSAGMRRTLDMVFDGCAVDPACAAAYPDPRGDYAALMEEARTDPRRVTVETGDGTDEVAVTEWVMANAVLNQLYSPYSFETLPATLAQIRDGDEAALTSILDTGLSGYAWLMRISVWCNEEYPFQDKAAVRRQQTGFPEFGGVDQSTVPEGVCEAAGFGGGAPPASWDQPAETAVPALIFAGQFDLATPPAWSAAAAAHMPNAQLAVFPSGGHVAGFTDCGGEMLMDFLEAPSEPVEAACLLDNPVPDFSPREEEDS